MIAEVRARGIAPAEAIFQRAEIGSHYEHEIEPRHSTGPSISVPIPIFNQGQPASARANARMRQAEERYLALAADIRSDVRAARDKLLLSRREVEYFKSTALPTRTRVTEESQLEYNAMQIGPFQLLQAKQEEVKTGADSVEAVRDYWSRVPNWKKQSAVRSVAKFCSSHPTKNHTIKIMITRRKFLNDAYRLQPFLLIPRAFPHSGFLGRDASMRGAPILNHLGARIRDNSSCVEHVPEGASLVASELLYLR